VTTFGFRGEALSALCALCDSVTVVTATKETAPLGTIIKLGKNGKVIDSSGKVARPVCAIHYSGTETVLVRIFEPELINREERQSP
jgi:DNA mismatch repair protein PMS2